MPLTDPLTRFAWIAAHPWLYPALEVVHLVGIGLLLGSLVLVELRVLGLGRALPLPELGRFALGLTLSGFGLAAASGLVLFISQAGDLIGNRAFVLKMLLLMVAGTNALLFHARGGLRSPDTIARLQTLLSLGLWITIILCGRWIAYS